MWRFTQPSRGDDGLALGLRTATGNIAYEQKQRASCKFDGVVYVTHN
jgi:hypothetical protein